MFRSLLIANRGEIALRVMRTAKRMGLRTIAVYSDADRDAPHVRNADRAVRIGGAAPKDSYLNVESLLRIEADAVHPGYGFLSENAAFAEQVLRSNRIWVGPPPPAMRVLGDKQHAKRLVRKLGLPALPGYEDDDQSDGALRRAARDLGFPLVIKAAAGGGGRGMRLARTEAELPALLAAARSEALHAFGDGRLMLETALAKARHVEVQIFADTHGNAVHLGERDCSVQRRHQKLIDESPSPALDAAKRATLGQAAIALARAAGYAGAGTVEFLRDADGRFWFMEVNTRLQVEHPVTEALTGLDLVEWQLRVAAGEALPLKQDELRFSGHAIEARLCAEDPLKDHLPQAGCLALWRPAEGIRTDHALESGIEIAPHYDSLVAKLVAHGPTRDEARTRLALALDQTVALGLRTNRYYLSLVLRDPEFAEHGATTDYLAGFRQPASAATEDWMACAVAATIDIEAQARAAGFGEWASWSNNPARIGRVRLRGSGAHDVAVRCESGTYRAEAGKLSLEIRILALSPGSALIEQGQGPPETVPWCRDGDLLCLRYLRRDWIFEDVTHRPSARRAAEAGNGKLAAPMNGRVVAVNAKPGETIVAGVPLVVLEAMKMEHGLNLPFSVRIKTIHVKAGAQVAPGHLLVEFEPA